MSFQINLSDPLKVFEQRIITEFLREINKDFRKKISPIRKLVSVEVAEAVYQGKEVQSMLYGSLSAELGFISADAITKQIYQAVLRSVSVDFKPFKYDGKSIIGNLNVVAIHDDFSDIVAGVPTATYISNGHNIDWLNWLLFEGDSLIIADYEISYGVYSPKHSRSGRAIMEKGNNGYRIPNKFSGTKTDNFITRAIDGNLEQKIGNIIEKVLSNG